MKRIKRIVIVTIFLIFVNSITHSVKGTEEKAITQLIENGIYEIETEIHSGKVVDISAASTLSRANVQIWDRSNVEQQRFQITYLGNGYYTIKNIKSGKVLDVDDAGTKNGTNVQQYTSNSTDAQKWKIEKTSNGYYNIISKCNGLYLTVKNSGTANGTNIEVNQKSEEKNQTFIFRKVTTVKGTQTIKDGTYVIATALDEKKVLDISAASTLSRANVQIWLDSNVPQQKFNVKYDGNGYYTITNVNSGKLLDVAEGKIEKGTNVQQYTSNSSDAQKWVIKKTDDGYYNIISKSSGIYLDVAGGKTNDGTNVQINVATNTDKQKFIFRETEDGTQTVEDGKYEIVTKLASNMIVDVSAGSSNNGANVQIWADANEKQQKFDFTYVGGGSYKIICRRSGKALTVSTSGTAYSSNVYQNTYTGDLNQLWKIEKNSDGTYYIISKYNGRYLDVDNGKTSNVTNVRVYVPNYSNAQKFYLEQREYGIDVSHWQSTIDFKTLSESETIDFMIIRAGHGITIKDREFENNYNGAKKYKIPVGVYLYAGAQSVEEARQEANYLVNLLNGKTFDLPVFYDIEEQDNLNKSTITQMFLEFYNIIKKAGYKPGLYANKYYLTEKIDASKIPSDCTIWVASYGKNDGAIPNDVYKYYGRFDIWQYTSNGKVPGIQGNVDCNVRYK